MLPLPKLAQEVTNLPTKSSQMMYCPKCKENFEEGSRRFCPTDGSRLVSDTAGSSGRPPGGIFANLIPKIEAISDLEDTLTDIPRFAVTDPPQMSAKPEKPGEIFFDLDDQELEQLLPSEQVTRLRPIEAEPHPIARKIDPSQVPSGHVDLGDAERAGIAAEFDLDNPERFVGRMVKGRYRVTEFLGGDETGLSYIADDQIITDKKVLVRILSEDGYDEITASILAEERVSLSHFSHPNVARLIDSGQFTNGTNFLVSEFVDALSVNDILDIHGPFSLSRTARIIRQAANALNEAHQEGIIHRDLRPQNLIIDATSAESETIKVVNFGASNGDPTEQNILYKAPEILEGRVSTVASDIFSLAVVGYEMLTGQMPFGGSTDRELFRLQQSGLATLPSEVRPDLPQAVDAVLSKALSPDAAARYPKARDLGDALFSALTESTERALTTENPFDSEVTSSDAIPAPDFAPSVEPIVKRGTFVTVEPAVPIKTVPTEYPPVPRNPLQTPPEPAPRRRLPFAAIAGVLLLAAVVAAAWYFLVQNRTLVDRLLSSGQPAGPSNSQQPTPAAPPPGDRPQPANSVYYENNKQNLKGDLLKNFVGFDIYYPKDWKVNGPQQGKTPNARGKFLDISKSTPDGRMKEQMLISYYPSMGTFDDDGEKFAAMVKETNETLKKLLPGYQMVSEGEITFNGGLRAYEVKFQGGGTSDTGEKLVVWGRRLFVPAGQPGALNGFEITMLATSLANNILSVDDIGVRGELAPILDSFKPNQS